MKKDLDLMEYANDAAAQAAYVTNGNIIYDSSFLTGGTASADSVEGEYYASNACDGNEGTIFETANTAFPHWWKYDLGVGITKTIRKFGVKPYKDGTPVTGVKDFVIAGSNNDSDWTDIYTGQHADTDSWEYYTFDNSVAYRYYRVTFTSAWGGVLTRTILYELSMHEAIGISLQSYSESSIKVQGSYSLKGIAVITDSLNKTLTRTVSPTVDLSGLSIIQFFIRSSRTGSNIKIGLHDSGGTTTEITPNILSANTWQEVKIPLQNITNANKDAIDQIIITIVNADVENTFYIDDMFGYYTPQIIVS